MHIGPVADDNVYRTIRLFETGVYDAAETVKRLNTAALQDQWVLHTTGHQYINADIDQYLAARNAIPS